MHVENRIKKRGRLSFSQIRNKIKRRMHEPIADVGRWLRSVVVRHQNYFAVLGNTVNYLCLTPFTNSTATTAAGTSDWWNCGKNLDILLASG